MGRTNAISGGGAGGYSIELMGINGEGTAPVYTGDYMDSFGLYVGSNKNSLMTSPDGKVWTKRLSVTGDIIRVLSDETKSVILISQSGIVLIYTTTDGVNYENISNFSQMSAQSALLVGNDLYLIKGYLDAELIKVNLNTKRYTTAFNFGGSYSEYGNKPFTEKGVTYWYGALKTIYTSDFITFSEKTTATTVISKAKAGYPLPQSLSMSSSSNALLYDDGNGIPLMIFEPHTKTITDETVILCEFTDETFTEILHLTHLPHTYNSEWYLPSESKKGNRFAIFKTTARVNALAEGHIIDLKTVREKLLSNQGIMSSVDIDVRPSKITMIGDIIFATNQNYWYYAKIKN